MAENHGTVRAVAWRQVFPSLRLFSALRMALNLKALLLAAIAISGTVAGWRVLGQIFADAEQVPPVPLVYSDILPWDRSLPVLPVDRWASLEAWQASSPLVAAWYEISAPFLAMYRMDETPTFVGFVYLLCCALWGLVIWSFFGGAISRMAAVAFARQENVSLGQLFGFVHARWSAYLVAPLFPILGTFLVALLMAAAGTALRSEIGLASLSVVWPLVLLGGFVMAFLLIGLFFGFPLMWGAVSAEGTDAFGALSHSYSYVYQRPLQYLLYGVIAALAGVLGWYLVALFTNWTLDLTDWGISWGSGTHQIVAIREGEDLGRIGTFGAAMIDFWKNCLLTLAFGFAFSYFWTASTVIYFLLRRLVDATELDEVYMPEEKNRHGLPPLKTGADGMPGVDDEPVATSETNGGAKPEG